MSSYLWRPVDYDGKTEHARPDWTFRPARRAMARLRYRLDKAEHGRPRIEPIRVKAYFTALATWAGALRRRIVEAESAPRLGYTSKAPDDAGG